MAHDNSPTENAQSNNPGDYIWYELLTGDGDAAQKFYASILGWTFADSGQPNMDYRIVSAGGINVAGLMPLTKEMCDHGARPIWLGYIAVDDVDVSVDAIVKRGGHVYMAAMDIPSVGRIAMVADPQRIPFYVMKPTGPGKSLAFAYDRPRPGHCAWNELRTPDPAAAWKFYGELFGWKQDGEIDMGPMGKYQLIRHNGLIGAIMPTPGGGHPRWNPYFRVENIEKAKTAVEQGGGNVTQGPDEIAQGDFSMNCQDSGGVPFGLVGRR